MRCPSCNKFPAFNMDNEPEVDLNEMAGEMLEDKTYTVTVTGSCRIVLTSECCGEECKETTFDIEVEGVGIEKHADCTCKPGEDTGDWFEYVEGEASGTITDRSQSSITKTCKRGPNKGKTVQVPIPYRYQKRYYGAELTIDLTCGCGKSIGQAEWHDEVQASGMEEMG